MNLDSLLISKDAALLSVLRPVFEKISVNIEGCAEVQPGIDLMTKRKFDAVIIDCDDLPNGFDLLHTLRQTRSNAKSVSFARSEEHTSELQSLRHLVCRLLLE